LQVSAGHSSWHRLAWLHLFLAALCLALVLSDSAAGLALKFLLSKLVYSTSDGAVLFFLAFCVVAWLLRHTRLSWRVSRSAAIMLGVGLLLGYGAHLAATLIYLAEHHIPWGAHVYHWSSGSNSYTALLHSHQGKAAMAWLGGLFVARSNYDMGSALAGASSAWLIAATGLGFLLSLVGGLLRFPVFYRAYGGQPALAAAFLISATVAIKSIFDGGLLAYATPPALLLLASLLACSDSQSWSHFWRRRAWLVGALLSSAYLGLWLVLSPGDLPAVGAWLAFNIVLILLMTMAWRSVTSWIFRALMVSYLGVNLYFDAHDNLAPLLRQTDSAYRVAQFSATGQGLIKDVGPWIGQRVFNIYRDLGDDPWKPRKTLVWELPVQGIYRFAASFLPLDWDQASGQLQPTPSLGISRAGVIGNAWLNLELVVTAEALPPVFMHGNGNALSKNNYYVWLYQIDGMLRQGGWRTYVMLPHTAGNLDAGRSP